MKALILAFLMAGAAWAQCSTTAECQDNVRANQLKLWELQADSTAAVINALIQTDATYADIKAAGVRAVNAPATNGVFDIRWVGLVIPDTLGISAAEKASAIATIKSQYGGQDSPSADVRIDKADLEKAHAALAIFAQ